MAGGQFPKRQAGHGGDSRAAKPAGCAASQDVSVVGIANMVYLCEVTSPTLSTLDG